MRRLLIAVAFFPALFAALHFLNLYFADIGAHIGQ